MSQEPRITRNSLTSLLEKQMPAIGNVVLPDAEGTPVNHTFGPVQATGSVGKYANRSGTTPMGWETLELSLDAPAGGRTSYKLQAKCNDPVEGVVDGQTVVVRNNSYDLRVNFSPLSTAQERLNTLKLASQALAHATVVAMAQNLEPVY